MYIIFILRRRWVELTKNVWRISHRVIILKVETDSGRPLIGRLCGVDINHAPIRYRYVEPFIVKFHSDEHDQREGFMVHINGKYCSYSYSLSAFCSAVYLNFKS